MIYRTALLVPYWRMIGPANRVSILACGAVFQQAGDDYGLVRGVVIVKKFLWAQALLSRDLRAH